MKRITSRQHPLVAACRALARGRGADEAQILLDGLHLVQEALRAGVTIETAAIDSTLMERPETSRLVSDLQHTGVDVVEVSQAVLASLSPVASPSGIVAIARRPALSLGAVFRRSPHLVVLAVDVQDPGNAGAIARAAEAGGATGLVLCGASADPFGWKALRGSMGSLLRLPTVGRVSWSDAASAAREAGAAVIATQPRGGALPQDIDLRRSVAFLLGGEGPGLPAEAVLAADAHVSIPMQPPVESLNVAVAAALLVYEAARQRATTQRPAGR